MVFKAYDIRGIFREQLDENFAYSLGRVLGEGYKNILVANDVRIGSKELLKPFIFGIMESGGKVSYGGTISTPLMYFGTRNRYDLGVIITASHNPPEYTGFKMCDRNALPISPVEEIKPIFKKEKLEDSQRREVEEIDLEELKVDVSSEYKRFFLKRCNSYDIKVAVDFANGSTSIVEKEILEELLKDHIFINDYPDGTFPAHQPDTLKISCLRDIIKTVRDNNCDIGIIFDGDGDRIGIVDERGDVLQGDMITAIISREILREKEGVKIIYDLRCSKVVPEVIERYGGIPVKSRVGHYFIKKLMQEIDGEFAGELSNHFYFKEIGYFEGPLIALNYILSTMEERGEPLSKIWREYKKYYHSGEINFKVKDQRRILEGLKEIYKNCEIEELDGLSVYCKGWWFNIRPSNTEPLLRLNLEGDTEEIMKEKVEEIKEIVNKLDGGL
ncbi:phosphomannomutase [Methanofervidicoccus sp. A16]|uniref:phosphomannomutase/phosphoglucomutase n=1 Tax=Methanofervidicoccus sp. A16 TaxID=2607662 RepID=UPI001188C928|nr:phosphomannomutase/phosphoglucomutase [Methanofervidicoccus sp. A16]AXI24966.1 phosphomannomutase [Methanofervidicoccus sp. A16]